MPLEDLPKPIQNLMFNGCSNKNYEPMPNTFSITEILYCLRKAYFRRVLGDKPKSLKTARNFYRGNVWDNIFCSQFSRNQLRCTYRCHDRPVCISGKLDFIDENGVVTDLKSPATTFYVNKQGKPSKEYELQVRFYCFCNAQTKGQVMYWDGNECLKFPVDVTDKSLINEMIDMIEKRASIMYDCLNNNVVPSKKDSEPQVWECRDDMCEFKEECKANKDDNTD